MDEHTRAHVLTYAQQGNVLAWDSVEASEFIWQRALHCMTSKEMKWLANAIGDTLPTGHNLCLWQKTQLGQCRLCGHPKATLLHILNNCPVALQQGRYEWRHNTILHHMARCILVSLRPANAKSQACSIAPPLTSSFVSAGFLHAPAQPSSKAGQKQCPRSDNILAHTNDWKFVVDLPEMHHAHSPYIPPELLASRQRPDMFMWSPKQKVAILLELTCPMEECAVAARRRKEARYLPELVLKLRLSGWNTTLFTAEIGSRGFACASSRRALHALGVAHVPQALRTCEDYARRCSYMLWTSRNTREWRSINMHQAEDPTAV